VNPTVDNMAFHPQLIRRLHTAAAPVPDRLALPPKLHGYGARGTYAQTGGLLIVINITEKL
jgi:hypothetical protein